MAASNPDWRTLVVCGTSVTNARSLSVGGTLSTNAGRTFAVMPRSTSHTSPRAAISLSSFALVEFEKHVIGQPNEIVVCREIVIRLGCPAQQFGQHFLALSRSERLDGVDRAFGCLRHSRRVAVPGPLVKFQWSFRWATGLPLSREPRGKTVLVWQAWERAWALATCCPGLSLPSRLSSDDGPA